MLIRKLWPKVAVNAHICISFYFSGGVGCRRKQIFFLSFNGDGSKCEANGSAVSLTVVARCSFAERGEGEGFHG